MNRISRLLLKLIVILGIILALGAGILLIFDKIFHTNSLQDIKNALNISTPITGEVEVVDTTPLEAEIKSNNLIILEPSTAVTLTTNKEVFVDSNNKTSLELVKRASAEEDKETLWYALIIKNIGVGDAVVNVEVKDKAGNSKKFEIALTRQSFSLPFGMTSIEPWKDSTYTADGDSLKAQVNKSHKLINDYAPTDLKNLNTDYLLYTNTGTITLRKEAADFLALMLKDLKKDTGKNVVIASGYRPYNEQYKIYAGYVRDMGQDETDKVSARPGFSEHQLGTAVDFIDQDSGLVLTDQFANSTVGKWINENSFKYGFVQSYPKGKEEMTGYSYEAWHFRYIGVANAKEVQSSGLTLKEWLEKNP